MNFLHISLFSNFRFVSKDAPVVASSSSPNNNYSSTNLASSDNYSSVASSQYSSIPPAAAQENTYENIGGATELIRLNSDMNSARFDVIEK